MPDVFLAAKSALAACYAPAVPFRGRPLDPDLAGSNWLLEALLEPVVGVGLVIEGRHFVVAAGAVEGDGLGEGAVGFELDDDSAGLLGAVLELLQQAAAEAEAAGVGGKPHALE